jgi:hypothetical protein
MKHLPSASSGVDVQLVVSDDCLGSSSQAAAGHIARYHLHFIALLTPLGNVDFAAIGQHFVYANF